MIGRQIDRYRILEEIGSGGMAVVYKGLDTALDREVAVKIMHPHLAGKEESRRRFRREAKAVARLRHPYILEIYDFSGDDAKESFIVTEYVRGRTLRAYADEVGFGLPEIAAMAIDQLAEALQHAHEAGVVHRDLKPENVMVRQDGVLKLMDFGIARMIEADDKMTMTGALVGSPLHMAPETIEGKSADHRADIFALGTIFYWLVTGQMAFQGNNTTQTLRLILEGSYPDARMLNPACSDELGEAIARCLQRDPAARFQSVKELRAALRAAFDECGIEAVEPELRAHFADPSGYREKLKERLVARLTSLGEGALGAKRQAKALGYFNRVLALDEKNVAVLGHLGRMNRVKALRRRLRRGAIALGGLAVLGAAGAGISRIDFTAAVLVEPVAVAPVLEPVVEPVVTEPVAVEPAAEAPDAGTELAAVRPPRPARPPPPKKKETDALATTPRPVRLLLLPQGAAIYVDRQLQKGTENEPTLALSLTPGEHLLGMTHKCCGEVTQTFDVPPLDPKEPHKEFRYGVTMSPLPSVVVVEWPDPKATVYLRGSRWGTVEELTRRGGNPVKLDTSDPLRRFAQRIELTVVNAAGEEHRLPVEIRGGETVFARGAP